MLMVEGGRVDHAHHAGNAARALEDMVAFNEAIQKRRMVVRDVPAVHTAEGLLARGSVHGQGDASVFKLESVEP